MELDKFIESNLHSETATEESSLMHPVLDFKDADATILTFIGGKAYSIKVEMHAEDCSITPWEELPSRKAGIDKAKYPTKRRTCYLSYNGIKKFFDVKSDLEPDVYGYSLIADLTNLLKDYIGLSTELDYQLVALWIIYTHMYTMFDSNPLLFFNGIQGSGKSRALRFIEVMAFNGWKLSDCTDAALKRSVNNDRGCYILDESESLGWSQDCQLAKTLRNVFLPYEEDLTSVKDSKGNWRTESRNLWVPVALANISGIANDPLRQRCITISMKNDLEYANSSDPCENDSELQEMYDRLVIWVLQYYEYTKDVYSGMDNILGMAGRVVQVYKPLLAIMYSLTNEEFTLRLASEINEKISESRMFAAQEDEVMKYLRCLLDYVNSDYFPCMNRDITKYINEQFNCRIHERKVSRLITQYGLHVDSSKPSGSLKYVLSRSRIEAAIKNRLMEIA